MNKAIYATAQTVVTNAAPGVLVLRVPSIGDSVACAQFEGVISRAIASRPRLVVVDLSDAESVSTVTLGSLLTLRLAVIRTGGQVRLADVQPMVRRVLDICRLDRLFTVHSSIEDAMDAVG